MDHDSFLAALGVIVVFGMPIAYAMASRWFAHQERMAMIARGIAPPPGPRDVRRMYRAGFAPSGGYDQEHYVWAQAHRSLRAGIVLTMIGFALVIGLSFIRPGMPGPWLLGGLIPMFVGLAQIAIAYLSGAGLRPTAFPGPPGTGESHPGPSPFEHAAPPSAPAGPYAWRPGSTPELERPPQPPEAR